MDMGTEGRNGRERHARTSGTAPIGRRVHPAELLGPLTELEQKHAPEWLWVAGKVELPLLHPRVAIVGTREPSEAGVEAARDLARSLAAHGVGVVSGLAKGIDTAAHRAAIEAGGRTIAVLGTPLSESYPHSNAALQQEIMREQVAVSQFPEGRPVVRSNFVLRNRTMALIADASVIIESGDTGGSLHQGWEAIRLGRPLFVRRQLLKDPKLTWPRKMVNYGALELDGPESILELVPTPEPLPSLDAPA
jgi:DNA processing protein